MYKDYALVKLNFGEKVLAVAPAWKLEAGDEVIINGERGLVHSVVTKTDLSEELEMVLFTLGQKEVEEIDCKVEYINFKEVEK